MSEEKLNDSRLENDWWANISEAQRQSINQGIEDVEKGHGLSSTEFWVILKEDQNIKLK
jgi:hypothetical protein